MNRIKKYLMFAFLSVTISSCGFGILFQVRYDFDISKDEIFEFAEKNKISEDALYLISDDYPKFLSDYAQNSNLTNDTMKYYKQPLQVLCYDYRDSLIGFIPNCLVRGTFTSASLKWNEDKVFDNFPIQTPRYIISKVDSSYIIDSRPIAIPPDSIFSYLNPVVDKKSASINMQPNPNNYKLFIFFGLMLENYSEDLIEEVQKSIEIGKKEGKSISVYYIITDELFDYNIN